MRSGLSSIPMNTLTSSHTLLAFQRRVQLLDRLKTMSSESEEHLNVVHFHPTAVPHAAVSTSSSHRDVRERRWCLHFPLTEVRPSASLSQISVSTASVRAGPETGNWTRAGPRARGRDLERGNLAEKRKRANSTMWDENRRVAAVWNLFIGKREENDCVEDLCQTHTNLLCARTSAVTFFYISRTLNHKPAGFRFRRGSLKTRKQSNMCSRPSHGYLENRFPHNHYQLNLWTRFPNT